MKHIILTFIVALCTLSGSAQSYTRSGVVFTQASEKSSVAKQTGFTYKDKNGRSYPIYITDKGRCFILKTSAKTGEQYKSYLKEDLCKEICREMGVTYIPKTTTK